MDPLPTWYKGVCDDVLKQLKVWLARYEQGEVAATRDWLDPKDLKVKPLPTKFGHRLFFKPAEVDHLVRIVGELKPHLKPDLLQVQKMVPRARMMSGGYRELVLAFYRKDIEEMVEAMETARQGMKATTLSDRVHQNVEQGKDPFEV